MITIPKRLRKLSKAADRDLIARGLKLSEECGELSAEILRYHGLKGANGKSQTIILDNLRLEAVDCLIMALDILVHTNTPKEQIDQIMTDQLDKWEKQLKKKSL
jgi:NTP pyrophosphatase (non-canonical NTP hydrolase)